MQVKLQFTGGQLSLDPAEKLERDTTTAHPCTYQRRRYCIWCPV